MRLTRCKDQPSQTLDEFYAAASSHADYATRGPAMIGLIARLRASADPREAYGLTSHRRLVLLAEDDSRSPWLVAVSVLDARNFYVEYLMPERLAPWPGAYVNGDARSEEEAARMVATAMDRSEGWAEVPGDRDA